MKLIPYNTGHPLQSEPLFILDGLQELHHAIDCYFRWDEDDGMVDITLNPFLLTLYPDLDEAIGSIKHTYNFLDALGKILKLDICKLLEDDQWYEDKDKGITIEEQHYDSEGDHYLTIYLDERLFDQDDYDGTTRALAIIGEQWEAINLMKLFEISVHDEHEDEPTHIIFTIIFDKENKRFIAQHSALDIHEEQSEKIAFKEVLFDKDKTLDEHLNELYTACTEAIINSTGYNLME